MTQGELELVVDAKADLGEGPSWDAEKKLLYWVNITACEVHMYNPSTREDRAINVGEQVGAVVPGSGQLVYVVMENGYYALHTGTGELTPIADPERDKPGNRFNDGKCDPRGRFWAGTKSHTDEPGAGALYCLGTDRSVTRLFGDVSCSNGIAWSPDYRIMYYIDTFTGQVAAFDFDAATGAIANKRIVVELPAGGGWPDGMTSDSEGMLWIGLWGGYRVARWDPRTGRQIGSVEVPAANVTSCCFGGDDLRDLYITTARTDVPEDELAKQPHAGGLFRIRTDVTGLPTFRYGG